MYDAIVIGSGIGGLTAAGLLAKVAGQRVLVLEKHTEPGGLTHSFSRDGATWDTGVHYIGQMAEGTTLRRYFDLLSNGELGWNPLPEPYDRFCYPGLDFPVPTGREAYIARLSALFPAEERAIRSWFRDTRRAARWLTLSFVQAVVPRPLTPLIRGFQRLTRGLATSTLRSQLDARFRSEELKALLASQWGGPRAAAVAERLRQPRHHRRALPRRRLVPGWGQCPDRPHHREGHRGSGRGGACRPRGDQDPRRAGPGRRGQGDRPACSAA